LTDWHTKHTTKQIISFLLNSRFRLDLLLTKTKVHTLLKATLLKLGLMLILLLSNYPFLSIGISAIL